MPRIVSVTFYPLQQRMINTSEILELYCIFFYIFAPQLTTVVYLVDNNFNTFGQDQSVRKVHYKPNSYKSWGKISYTSKYRYKYIQRLNGAVICKAKLTLMKHYGRYAHIHLAIQAFQ